MNRGDLYKFKVNIKHVDGIKEYWSHVPGHGQAPPSGLTSSPNYFDITYCFIYVKTTVCRKCQPKQKIFHVYSIEHNQTFELFESVFPQFFEKV